MANTNLETKLLRGSILYCDEIPIHRVTLGEMTEFCDGYSDYQSMLGLICIDPVKIRKYFKDEDSATALNYILLNIAHEHKAITDGVMNIEDENLLLNKFLSFLRLVTKEEVVFDFKNYSGFFIINTASKSVMLLGSDNFDRFINLIKERNNLKEVVGEDDENPSNDKAKQLLEQRKLLREKIKKSKDANDGEDLNIADLVSIYADAKNVPPQYVFENYDIYQFNNQFNRLKIMDEFHVGIQQLLAGAKKEDVNLQHWITKIKHKED